MTRLQRAFLGVLGLILVPCPGRSQTVGTWEVTPYLGMSVPISDVGPIGVTDGPRMMTVKTMDHAMSFGLLASRALGRSAWALTVRGLVTTTSEAPGTFDCVPGLYCPSGPPGSGVAAQSWGGVAGILVHPLTDPGGIDPFLTSGAGWKRTRYTWRDQENQGETRVHRSETRGMLQFGIGIDVEVRTIHLRIETSDFWTPEGKRLDSEAAGPGLSDLQLPRRPAEHDLHFTVGWVMSLG